MYILIGNIVSSDWVQSQLQMKFSTGPFRLYCVRAWAPVILYIANILWLELGHYASV